MVLSANILTFTVWSINKQSREEDVWYYLNLRLQNCFIFSSHFPTCSGGNFLSTVEFLQLYQASHFYFSLYWPNHLVSLFNYNSQLWLCNGIIWGALKSTDAWSHSRNFNWPQNVLKLPEDLVVQPGLRTLFRSVKWMIQLL